MNKNSSPALRASFLFVDFLLIILAYYQIKPASRSLFLEHLSADMLPWVWISSALTLGALMPGYQWLVRRFSRHLIVLGTLILFAALLLIFRVLMENSNATIAFTFYIFVDILSVVLVEQLWSMTNSSFASVDGKRWYGIVSSGGLIGGIIGSATANWMMTYTGMQTADLLISAAALLGLIFALSFALVRIGLLQEHDIAPPVLPEFKNSAGNWRILFSNRYLTLIAACLLVAQLVSPIVEYQFLSMVERNYTDRDERTAFLGLFLSAMSALALGINLLITPVIHRFFGAIGGLLLQPFLMMVFAFGFAINATTSAVMALRLADKSLAYSITRASRELLYIPIDSVTIYRAKAWIDMFGYRLFKILGALVIQLFTVWLPVHLGAEDLTWVVVLVCAFWILCILTLRHAYALLEQLETRSAVEERVGTIV